LASGAVDANWKGSLLATDAAFALDVAPPAALKAGEIPLTLHSRGNYRRLKDELEMAQFNLSTPASRVQASGILSASSSLRFSVFTSDFEEWRPIITAPQGQGNLPFRVNDSVTLNGSVGGTFSSPTVTGTLVVKDLEVTLPATARTAQRQVQWDSLSTGLQVSSSALILHGGSLRSGDTIAAFDGTLTLQDGQFTEDSPFAGHVSLRGVDVGSTEGLVGYDYPVSGKVDLDVQVSGTQPDPHAQGQIHARNAMAWGESIAQLDADVQVGEGETTLSNVLLTHEDSEIRGSAAYNPSRHSFRLDVTGKNFDLARIEQIQPAGLLMEGRSDFALQGTGTTESPALSAQVQVRDLKFDHELAGGLALNVTTKNGELRLTGHSEFVKGTVQLEGGVQLRQNYPATLSFHFDQIDADALWRAYLSGKLTGHSAVSGSLTVQGPLFHAHQWTMDGNLSNVALDVEYAKLHNVDAVRFTFAQQTAHIEQLHMIGEGTGVVGYGYVQFANPRNLNLVLDGKVDLKLLNSVNADLTGSGLLSMNMNVGGTISDPLPQGHIQISNGAVTYAGLPSGLSEMNGSLVFTRDSLHIEKMAARTGGGSIDLKGDATHYHGQLSFDVTAGVKEVRLRYPPGVSSTANAELHWTGTPAASAVIGDIMVTKLAVTPNFDFSSYLESSRRNAALATANSPLFGVKLDVHVQTAPELQMKTAVARLSGDADLRLRGSVARPAVLGRADILEGDATFNGTKFRLERGDITFANPVAIEPQLNLEASTHVRNYDLDITVTGTPDRMAVNYRSEPPLPKSDIIALLALGRTSQESEQLQQQSGQSVFNDEASALIINQAINSTVSSRVQKLFGVSRIKIDPQGLTTETNPTARGPQVTIEQQFANNVSLTYSTNVSQSNQQIIQGEYFFTRNISVVGTRDQNGVVSFDVRVRRRK
jgi:translocation and assembly module TamB